MTPRNIILEGDVRERLAELAPASIDTVITSPPFYALRDYGMKGQIGLEPTVEHWVEALRSVMAEIARVLKPTGSVWIDLGDSFSRHPRYGAPAKSLLCGPERLLLKLLADGWIVRGKVIWAKTNPMPSSVADRLNTTYDVVYHLTRSRSYFFDLDSIREPHRSHGPRGPRQAPDRPKGWAGPLAGSNSGLLRARAGGVPGHWLGKNIGDVWPMAASNFRGAHFATFPEALVRRPLLATCPEALCTACGQPWKRAVTVRRLGLLGAAGKDPHVRRYPQRWETVRQVGELQPQCQCNAPSRPGIVLDPFGGAGTVAVVAKRLGRDWLLIELNPSYIRLASERIDAATSKPSIAA